VQYGGVLSTAKEGLMTVPVRRALLSVSDKTGLIEFACALRELGVEIISTGGTAKALQDAGVSVVPIEQVTGHPEMLDGRVKTLHPAIHAGILYRRDLAGHREAMRQSAYEPVDLVCVNLYPFADTVRSGGGVQDCIENIDIGGPALIRSAAKNHEHVVVLVDPADYPRVIGEMKQSGGCVGLELRRKLAAKAFAQTAEYDSMIATWMRDTLAGPNDLPESISFGAKLVYHCRYGENPHQRGAFYRQQGTAEPCIGNARFLHGKELSFNNLCDADAALEAVKDFAERPACVIVKHMNPCGAAQADTLPVAFDGALSGDPVSAYGGIVAFSRTVDAQTAEHATARGLFFEVMIAPDYDEEALGILTTRRKWGASLRLLSVGSLDGWRAKASGFAIRQVVGGLLVQDRDLHEVQQPDLRVVTQRTPTEQEWEALLFAWRAVKHVKSNAIVLAQGRTLVGVGAGQMNRVQSVRLAVAQAGKRAAGAVLASDAFFPFKDGPEAAADAGVTAIIQPGGSIRDEETIALCNERKIAMVFTGIRHFRH